VVADDRGDVASEVRVVDTSTGRKDLRTGMGKAKSDPFPNAPAGARHERNLVGQPTHIRFPFRCRLSRRGRRSVTQFLNP
jgi:hypothetical protein